MKPRSSTKRRLTRGESVLEFAFALLILMPLALGGGAIGVNLIRTQGTVQLARDAGNMYSRGTDFSLSGSQAVLNRLGANVGLNGGSGNALVILSALTYVDVNACSAQGQTDSNGNPTSGCTNYQYWVFAQRLQIGNQSIRTSNYGSPLTSGPNGVTLDAKGNVSPSDQVMKSGARAIFSSANGINPYQVLNGNVSGMPSGQKLYLAEAAAKGFAMPPFVNGSPSYSFGFF